MGIAESRNTAIGSPNGAKSAARGRSARHDHADDKRYTEAVLANTAGWMCRINPITGKMDYPKTED
jgi:hypothetical protein